MASMELFRGDGRRTWQLRTTDHRGVRRQLSTYTDKRTTALVIANKIDLMIDYRRRGDGLPPDMVKWLHDCHEGIGDKLKEWEIVESRTADGGRPLYHDPRPSPLPADWKDPPASLLDLWELELTSREVTAGYVSESKERVRVVLSIEAANQKPMRHAGDITAEGVLQRIRELRRIGPPPKINKPRKKLGPQTCEHYLTRTREFVGWLVTRGFLPANPLLGVRAYSPEVIAQTKSRDRRALTAEEQAHLVTGTAGLPHRWNMDGSERAMIYRLALRTGLRANEIRTLNAANFNFFARSVTVLSPDAKARRQETLPLAAELVDPLREHCAGKMPQAPAFTPLSTARYCRMLRDDLQSLGIPYRDQLGRYADFHALRHSFGTDLAHVVMPSVHMKLMRHRKIETTMKYYTHVEDQDKTAAIAKLTALPEVPAPATEAG